VEFARRRLSGLQAGERPDSLGEALTIYTYTPGAGEDIFGLAARSSIPYSALATVNRLAHPASLEPGRVLLLPSVPGIFVPEYPDTDLERLILSARANQGGIILTLTRNGGRERFRFIPGSDFTAAERAFFLNTAFRFPLLNYRITSGFGMRISPITGTPRIHEGLDLAAPEGTEVFAVREGVVTDLGEDPVYGKYVVIRHGENWASLYGHLSLISTSLRSIVRSGTLIGRVGSTGQSTGPHLHFELRQNGRAQDPGKLLFRENQ
jgi:murein DD-endopeptidase MepM/ murein hydrolase activator NlpD